MHFKKLKLAVLVTASSLFSLTANAVDTAIEDPYKDDQDASPWTKSMKDVTTVGGRILRGDATLLSGKDYDGFDSYSPFVEDRTEVLNGYGSTSVGVGCDGINLGGVIDGQMNQYGNMVEGFIQSAPAMAIMYLAYSQPVVKAVIDEMNGVGEFGLDLSNMTCSGVRAIADKAAEEKAQSMAEARCTAEAGYKDPECMSDDGILSSMADVMRDTKKATNERAGAFLGTVSNASGGLVRFNAGIDGNAVSSSASESGTNGSTNQSAVSRAESCENVDGEGLRTLILAASGIQCSDIVQYGSLLPDYQISDEGISGVMPRTLTLKKLATDMVSQYSEWVTTVLSTPEDTYVNSEAFKAIYNRTNVSITVEQHRAINRLMNENSGVADPAKGLVIVRNLSQLIALKDLSSIVGRLEIAVLTGIQNQPDEQLLPDFRKKQFIHAVETLNTELSLLTEEVGLDQRRNSLTQTR